MIETRIQYSYATTADSATPPASEGDLTFGNATADAEDVTPSE